MAEETLAKVILFVDGSVHLWLQDYRTFYMSANSLIAFSQDPLNYIRNDVTQQKESTKKVNPAKRPLDKSVGICLLQYTTSGKLICNFQEIYQFVFTQDEQLRDEPLNMQSFILKQDLSSPKSFLLKYYLEFVNSFDKNTTIKNKLEIDEDILFSTMREIFNSVFYVEPIKTMTKNLDERVTDIKHKELFPDKKSDTSSNMIPITEYAALYEVTRDFVHRNIKNGHLKTAIKGENGNYLIDRNEVPPYSQNLATRTRGTTSASEQYLGTPEDWPAKKVEEYIRENRLFSPVVGKYIYSKQELDYYVNRRFFEVEWNNRRCLIDDVKPDLTTDDGVSNRERMLKGIPPVIETPSGEYKQWEIHHLGQRNEVFVTLPHHIHIGKGYNLIFHASAPSENLHGPEFEREKSLFWKQYIDEYDKAKSFEKIPHIYPSKSTKPRLK